jgi:hypothetical protein
VYLSAWQQARYQEVMAYHWIQLYRSRYLYGETSLWLPLAASPLDKWRLDETEGYHFPQPMSCVCRMSCVSCLVLRRVSCVVCLTNVYLPLA